MGDAVVEAGDAEVKEGFVLGVGIADVLVEGVVVSLEVGDLDFVVVATGRVSD